ncbi:piggyBac transposable element-derived protein 5 isoform X2 [Myotis myotis]|uniref:PiggyBac transposable element derived 5 n=1 Tax=Myotis myotis TaxID=51298 RepID=A0A7J7RVI9_MYOMY|nr:piggyBac transposable element-derived protein 5 isoform X2 [Myotis myotis]KAF6279975.1 piggyBac transposable element derived 5 [Myotis myotis]
MAEGGGGARRRAPALLEAARARYESLHISDDVFGESGPDSGGNPFYSTSAASRSSSAASSDDDEHERPGPPPCVPAAAAAAPEPEEEEEEEEEEDGSGWSAALRDRPPPRFEDTGGPTRKMPPSASAMDFFQLFVPDNMLKNMVVQTNLYARKFQERFGSDGAWADVTLAEMKAFLGYMVSTSISHCESVLSIWSGGFYSNRGLAGVMSQARFEKILKYFHVVAFRSSQATHGLYKVQPFLDALQSSFDAAFRPSQTQVLHEPLIDEDPVFIATCTERELRKRKKRKFSLWVRQCSATGFIVQIYVHLKEGMGPDGLDALKNKPQLHGAVARNLCRNAAGKNYIVFTGPSITSLALFEEFEKQGIYCCGLLSSQKSDCTGLPRSMLASPATPPARGQHRIRTKGSMSLICWYNKGHFRFLTNAYSPLQHGAIIKRRSGGVPCPLAVEAFAAHLSYICRYDDKYSKYFISHKPNKTWQQVFWFAVSIAINNAYILYKLSDAYHVQRYSRAQFGERLVRELLGLEDASPTP